MHEAGNWPAAWFENIPGAKEGRVMQMSGEEGGWVRREARQREDEAM